MKIIEKSIAICVLVLGIFSITMGIWDLWIRIDLINEYKPESSYQISITQIFKSYHYRFITTFIEIFGGLSLFFRKRIGYYLTIFICSKYVIGFSISLTINDLKVADQNLLIIKSILGAIYLACTLLLLLPEIKKTYSITKLGLMIVLTFSLLVAAYDFG